MSHTDEIEGAEDRARRWYRLRPEPRRRTDFMGVNSTWWIAGMARPAHSGRVPVPVPVPVVVVR